GVPRRIEPWRGSRLRPSHRGQPSDDGGRYPLPERLLDFAAFGRGTYHQRCAIRSPGSTAIGRAAPAGRCAYPGRTPGVAGRGKRRPHAKPGPHRHGWRDMIATRHRLAAISLAALLAGCTHPKVAEVAPVAAPT